METVKTLLENTKQNLEMQMWWAEEHNKEPQFIKEIPTLKQKIADIDEALLRLFSVSNCECKNLPKGEIAISSKALTDPNWKS